MSEKCPFCESEDTYKGQTEEGDVICCAMCQASGPVASKEEDDGSTPEELWRTRPTEDRLTAELSEARAEIAKLIEALDVTKDRFMGDINAACLSNPYIMQLNIKRHMAGSDQEKLVYSFASDHQILALNTFDQVTEENVRTAVQVGKNKILQSFS